jgi:hypothetical protein
MIHLTKDLTKCPTCFFEVTKANLFYPITPIMQKLGRK